MNVELKPHTEINHDGSKSHADVYPFVNGRPEKQLATCAMCELYKEDEEWCDGWVNDKDNAPLFCGPICTKFTPNNEAVAIISALEIQE